MIDVTWHTNTDASWQTVGKANDLLLQEQEKKSGNPLNADDDNNPITDSGVLKVLEV